MSANTFIFPSLVAAVVFVLYMLVMKIAGHQESTSDRIRRLAGNPEAAKEEDAIVDPLRQEQEMSPLAETLEQLMSAIGMDTEGFRKNSQMLFYRAGIHSPNGPVYYLFFKRIGFVLFLLLGIWIATRPAEGLQRTLHYMVGLVSAILGLLGPDMVIRNKREKREKILQRSFPDALDLLLVCVESGLALDGALSRVCKELGRACPEITQELNRTRLELTLLNDRAQALTNLAERTDMLAFRSLVTTLLQSEKFGTSLTDTLRVLSEDFRHTRLMLAEEKAGRLPVLMTIPLITLLLPALFLIIMGPAIINVLNVLAGR
jgi:tight adherence protein C